MGVSVIKKGVVYLPMPARLPIFYPFQPPLFEKEWQYPVTKWISILQFLQTKRVMCKRKYYNKNIKFHIMYLNKVFPKTEIDMNKLSDNNVTYFQITNDIFCTSVVQLILFFLGSFCHGILPPEPKIQKRS